MNQDLSIEVIARAVIISENKLVVCKANGKDWHFLPGGHVEFSESAKDALVREIKEEMGVNATVGDFIGVVENTYEQDGIKHHEINLLFSVEVDINKIVSREEHISFSLVDVGELSSIKLLPEHLKEALMRWLSENKSFWVGNM